MGTTTADVSRQHAWDYFALHSSQRMTAMNYYLVVSSILATAIITSFDRDFVAPRVRVPAGLLLLVVSFVFWRLDLRTRALIKMSEVALSDWERLAVPKEHGAALLFTSERQLRGAPSWLLPVSYYECFRLMFALFGLFGLLASLTPYLLGV